MRVGKLPKEGMAVVLSENENIMYGENMGGRGQFITPEELEAFRKVRTVAEANLWYDRLCQNHKSKADGVMLYIGADPWKCRESALHVMRLEDEKGMYAAIAIIHLHPPSQG